MGESHEHWQSQDVTSNEEAGKLKQLSTLSTSSLSGILMLTAGTLAYGSLAVVTRLSIATATETETQFNTNGALLVAEFGKLFISFCLLCYLNGTRTALQLIRAVPFVDWFLFAVPAVIYSVTNNIPFYALQYMDPGTLHVLDQCKIMSTAFLWWLCFKCTLDRQQWLSLCTLCLGSVLVALPNGDVSQSQNTMFIIWPYGPLLIFISIILSAVSGVYTEYVYKTFSKNRSLHLDNLSMYFWGCASNAAQYVAFNEGEILNVCHGFNRYTWLHIVVMIALGLSIAFVVKYFNNIIKLLMNGASVLVTGVLTFVVFGIAWTVDYAVGVVFVVCSVLLYKSETKLC